MRQEGQEATSQFSVDFRYTPNLYLVASCHFWRASRGEIRSIYSPDFAPPIPSKKLSLSAIGFFVTAELSGCRMREENVGVVKQCPRSAVRLQRLCYTEDREPCATVLYLTQNTIENINIAILQQLQFFLQRSSPEHTILSVTSAFYPFSETIWPPFCVVPDALFLS